MKVAIVREISDRKACEKAFKEGKPFPKPKTKEIIGYEEVDEKEFYKPLAEMYYNHMHEEGLI